MRTRRTTAAAIIAMALVAVPTVPAHALSSTEIAAQIKDLRATLSAIAADLNQAERELTETDVAIRRHSRVLSEASTRQSQLRAAISEHAATQFMNASLTNVDILTGEGIGGQEAIRRDLAAGRPVVLEVPGHYIAAVGLDGDVIRINDPFYADRTTLDAYAGRVLSARPDVNCAVHIHTETGNPMFGFPAGEGGLMHRFFQGYLVPAYSGGLVTTFTSVLTPCRLVACSSCQANSVRSRV